MRLLSGLPLAVFGAVQLVATAPSPGCANAAEQSQVDTDSTTSVKVQTSDGARNYLLYIPKNYKTTTPTPAPLILSYHGGSRDAEHQEQLDQFNSTFFNKNYVVVYPNSIDGFWQGSPGVTADDIGFTKTILTQVGNEYCIDTERIYATGKSQGGGMAALLAADPELSTQIAAFAPVSGAFYVSDTATCHPDSVSIPSDPGRPDIPMLEFHGEADDVIPYDGGQDRGDCLPAIEHFMQSWAQINGLDPNSNTTSRVKGATDKNATVFQFGEGDSLGMVTHIMVGEDIGHDWPSTEDNEDNTLPGHHPASFNASSVIIDFFNSHPMPTSQAAAPATTGGITDDGTSTAGVGPAKTGKPDSSQGISSDAVRLSSQLGIFLALSSVAFWCVLQHFQVGLPA